MYQTDNMAQINISSYKPIDELYQDIHRLNPPWLGKLEYAVYCVVDPRTNSIIPLYKNKSGTKSISGTKNLFNRKYAEYFGSLILDSITTKQFSYLKSIDLGIEYIKWLFKTGKLEIRRVDLFDIKNTRVV